MTWLLCWACRGSSCAWLRCIVADTRWHASHSPCALAACCRLGARLNEHAQFAKQRALQLLCRRLLSLPLQSTQVSCSWRCMHLMGWLGCCTAPVRKCLKGHIDRAALRCRGTSTALRCAAALCRLSSSTACLPSCMPPRAHHSAASTMAAGWWRFWSSRWVQTDAAHAFVDRWLAG